MANIVLFGFTKEHYQDLKAKFIDPAIQELGIEDNTVVTNVLSTVRTCQNESVSRPFLQICSDTPADILDIKQTLKEKGFKGEVESIIIHDFEEIK